MLSAAKIYWIVKNGIKMTGMHAFGPTHDEQELWSLIALVKEMPRMSPEQYRQLVIKLTNPGGDRGQVHTHEKPEREKGS